MRICIVGAGAVGGYLGFRLAEAGHDVSLIARGKHLDDIRREGLGHRECDGRVRRTRAIRATDCIREAGVQDLVILAVKSHQIPPIASSLPALFDDDTPVVALQNGIPWWYFHGHGGCREGTRIEAVDPGGIVSRHVDGSRVIGCVAWGAYDVPEPAIVSGGGSERDRFPLGELDGSMDARVQRIAQTFIEAGIRSSVVADIRAEKWLKAWGNAALNPIGALAHASLGEIYALPASRDLAGKVMAEAQQVAQALGVTFPVTLHDRLASSGSLGDARTSTHQDVESGRPLEIDGLVGAVVELGRLTGIPTPTLDALYACCKLLDHVMARRRIRVVSQKLD